MTSSTTVLSVENALLARYGEVLPDGTVTVVGGGISEMRRSPGNNAVLFLVATVITDGPAGPTEHTFRVALRGTAGQLVMEGTVQTRTDGPGRRRIPFAVPVVFPSDAPAGDWQVSVAVDGDLRVIAVHVE